MSFNIPSYTESVQEKPTPNRSRIASLFSMGLAAAALNCGGAKFSSAEQSEGGANSHGGLTANGGNHNLAGQAVETGGVAPTGGTAGTGNVMTTGGDMPVTGGVGTGGIMTGGTGTGGEITTGGTGTGGEIFTGGTGTGGEIATGGTETGGAVNTGGTETGGVAGSGGVINTGGTGNSAGAEIGGTGGSVVDCSAFESQKLRYELGPNLRHKITYCLEGFGCLNQTVPGSFFTNDTPLVFDGPGTGWVGIQQVDRINDAAASGPVTISRDGVVQACDLSAKLYCKHGQTMEENDEPDLLSIMTDPDATVLTNAEPGRAQVMYPNSCSDGTIFLIHEMK
jgi:hypothetical protein